MSESTHLFLQTKPSMFRRQPYSILMLRDAQLFHFGHVMTPEPVHSFIHWWRQWDEVENSEKANKWTMYLDYFVTLALKIINLMFVLALAVKYSLSSYTHELKPVSTVFTFYFAVPSSKSSVQEDKKYWNICVSGFPIWNIIMQCINT